MMKASEKADRRAAAAVEFSRRHPWSKVFCLGAVAAVYSTEYLRLKGQEIYDRFRAESERPAAMRITAGALGIAFAFMVTPFSEINAGASAYVSEAREVPAGQLPVPEGYLPLPAAVRNTVPKAFDPEKYMIRDNGDGTFTTKAEESRALTGGDGLLNEGTAALTEIINDFIEGQTSLSEESASDAPSEETKTENLLLTEGLCEENNGFSISLSSDNLRSSVTARFTSSKKHLAAVKESFEFYNIPTEDLEIYPVDVTLYRTGEKVRLNLVAGYTADITFPVPEKMNGDPQNIKVIRLEKDGPMTILDSELTEGENGNVIKFTTEHFSVFALVSYKSALEENIESGAPLAGSGTAVTMTPVSNSAVFPEDKRRFRKNIRRRRVYRIKRRFMESEKLL